VVVEEVISMVTNLVLGELREMQDTIFWQKDLVVVVTVMVLVNLVVLVEVVEVVAIDLTTHRMLGMVEVVW
jgi:hypothetical protein